MTADAVALAGRRDGDVVEQEVVGRRQEDDDADDGIALAVDPNCMLSDALTIVVEHRRRLPADALDVFGVDVIDDALHDRQVGEPGRSDAPLAHRDPPPQVGQSGSFGSLTR